MTHERISTLRKARRLTQEQLSEMSGISLRTIQRIENNGVAPRTHTLQAIARALNVSVDDLSPQHPAPAAGDDRYFLTILVLSSFSFLCLPYLHFLIPRYLLRRRTPLAPPVAAWGRQLVISQMVWVILLNGALLAAVCYNILLASDTFVDYLFLFAFSYAGNAVWLCNRLIQVRRRFPVPAFSVLSA